MGWAGYDGLNRRGWDAMWAWMWKMWRMGGMNGEGWIGMDWMGWGGMDGNGCGGWGRTEQENIVFGT
jgi:hypothetical protein